MLAKVNMGLAGGVVRRCPSTIPPVPEILTLRISSNPIAPVTKILSLKKHGVSPIGECDFVVLEATDSLQVECLVANDRQTEGSGARPDATHNSDSVALTLILAADREQFCDQLGCEAPE